MLISIKAHITCDFPGGVRTPYPPSGSTNVVACVQVSMPILARPCVSL